MYVTNAVILPHNQSVIVRLQKAVITGSTGLRREDLGRKLMHGVGSLSKISIGLHDAWFKYFFYPQEIKWHVLRKGTCSYALLQKSHLSVSGHLLLIQINDRQ